MNTEVRQIALGTAALALAAAACLSPIAHADISVPLAPGDSSSSDDGGVGGSAGKARNNRGATARANTDSGTSAGSDNTTPDSGTSGSTNTAPDAPAADAPKSNGDPNRASVNITADATGTNPLLQNSLWWFGAPNPTPPPSTIITQTEPLAGLPGWTRPAFGWFTENNLETCVLGLSTTTQGTVGPYGTSTTSFSSGGC